MFAYAKVSGLVTPRGALHHRYNLQDIIIGKVYFLLVRIKIKHMELNIIRREQAGSGTAVTPAQIVAAGLILCSDVCSVKKKCFGSFAPLFFFFRRAAVQ